MPHIWVIVFLVTTAVCSTVDSNICSVCYDCVTDPIELAEVKRLCPCGHPFHLKCVEEWLKRAQKTCPYCRAQSTVKQPPDHPQYTLENFFMIPPIILALLCSYAYFALVMAGIHLDHIVVYVIVGLVISGISSCLYILYILFNSNDDELFDLFIQLPPGI